MTEEPINLPDAYQDLTKLSHRELATLIQQVCNLRKAHPSNKISIEEISLVLFIATSEKNSRASTRLAKVAIGIALGSLAVATVGMWR